MASFGKDEKLISATRVVVCDIDSQPGLYSIVGVGNSSFLGQDPYEANLSILTQKVNIVKKIRTTFERTNIFDLPFSSRRLQSRKPCLTQNPQPQAQSDIQMMSNAFAQFMQMHRSQNQA